MDKLWDFMARYEIQEKKIVSETMFTHQMLYAPYGFYNIPLEANDKFLELYTNAIMEGFVPSIVEKHLDTVPIVIDLNFIQLSYDNRRFYTNETMRAIIEVYNTAIKRYVLADNIFAFVLEKSEPDKHHGEYFDGIHIIYPNICTTPQIQKLIRKEFLIQAHKQKIFNKIPLMTTLENVVNENVIYDKGWLMYGSSKNPPSSVYYVTKCYKLDHSNNKLLCTDYSLDHIDNIFDVKYFIGLLSCRKQMV